MTQHYVIHMLFVISCHLFQFEVAIPSPAQCFPSQLHGLQSTVQDTEATHRLQRAKWQEQCLFFFFLRERITGCGKLQVPSKSCIWNLQS